MINIGLSTWSFLPLAPLEAVDKILKLGFDCVELWGDIPHFWPRNYLNSPLLIKKLKNKLNKFKGPNSIHSTIVNLADKNPGLREEAFKQIKETITLADKLNLKHITLHLGKKFSMQSWGFEKIGFNIIIKSLKKLASFASKKNIFICLENAPENFGFKSSEMKRIIELTKNPQVKITFDAAHCNLENQSIIKFLKENFISIHQLHISDNLGAKDNHLPIGKGDINFFEIFKYLKKHNFSGNIIGEFMWKKEEHIKVAREYYRKATRGQW